MTVTAQEIYGDPTDRLIERLWDGCAEFMEARSRLLTRYDRNDIAGKLPPGGDKQLAVGLAAAATMPRYLYLNQRQWEDAPAKLQTFVSQMDLKVLTSKEIPPDTGHLSLDELDPHEVGKAVRRGQQRLPVRA